MHPTSVTVTGTPRQGFGGRVCGVTRHSRWLPVLAISWEIDVPRHESDRWSQSKRQVRANGKRRAVGLRGSLRVSLRGGRVRRTQSG